MRTRLYSVISFFWTLLYFIELRAVNTANTFVAATALLVTVFANCTVFCVGVHGYSYEWPKKAQLAFLAAVMLKFCAAAVVALYWQYFEPGEVYPLFIDVCLSATIAFHAWFVQLHDWASNLANATLQAQLTANMHAMLNIVNAVFEDDRYLIHAAAAAA